MGIVVLLMIVASILFEIGQTKEKGKFVTTGFGLEAVAIVIAISEVLKFC